MSNYPNMYHCRFENTYQALQQIREDLTCYDNEISSSEQRYREKIQEMILELAEEIEEMNEYDEEFFDDGEE